MLEIGAFQAKNSFSALLDRVEKGEEITITRRGRVVAILAPAGDDSSQRGKALAAAERLRAMRKGVTLGDLTLGDLVADGRR